MPRYLRDGALVPRRIPPLSSRFRTVPSPFQASTVHLRMLFEPYRLGVWGYCCEGRTRRIALYQSPYVASAAREARDRSATNVNAPLALPSKDASKLYSVSWQPARSSAPYRPGGLES